MSAKKGDFDEAVHKIAAIELFSALDEAREDDRRILRILYDSFVVRDYRKGDVILREGEVGDDFYILVEGAVQVLRKTPSGDTIAIAELDAGQQVFFGESALLDSDSRTATVKALVDCRTLALSGRVFRSICDKEPRLGYHVVLCLANRMKLSLQRANSDIATLYEALFREIEGSSV